MVKIFANDSIVYIQDEMKINDAIKNIYEDVNNRRRIKAALKDYHFDHMIQDDKSMAVRKLEDGKDVEHLHISADDLHDNHVKFLEFLKNFHVEEVQSTDVYLDVKTNQQNNIFSAEEVKKIKKLKEIINNDYTWNLRWDYGNVNSLNKASGGYVRVFDDINFSLLKKILKVCLVRYNAQAVTSTMIPAVKTRPKEEIKSVKRLKTAIDKGYAWFLGWDVGSVYNYGKAYYYYARPNEVKPLMKEFINLYLQAHGNENN